MSVEPCIIRVTPHEFTRLQERPETLTDFIEDGYETGASIFNDSPDVQCNRMFLLGEFGMLVLTGFDDDSPLCGALIGWDSPLMESASHGHGGAYFHTPERVRAIAEELKSLPDAHLRERFENMADNIRISAAGYLDGDAAIIEYQQGQFRRLREFYREAAEQGDYILLMLV